MAPAPAATMAATALVPLPNDVQTATIQSFPIAMIRILHATACVCVIILDFAMFWRLNWLSHLAVSRERETIVS